MCTETGVEPGSIQIKIAHFVQQTQALSGQKVGVWVQI